ncbi:MAG TPA: hypothetical protein VLH56_06350 [Dissulfurispiraceae bacterium]|nr:hypothetical protein [Dissulfurispiraceae bacterium]
MYRYFLGVFVVILCIVLSLPASAGLERCDGCHNNKLAAELKDRFKTAADLVRAAKNSKSPLMGSVRTNEEYLRDAAKDLGLK